MLGFLCRVELTKDYQVRQSGSDQLTEKNE